MGPAQRIVVNTLAQYVRLLFCVVLSLYSTRLVLQALGQSDYGIYSLVGGVIVMLAFITQALVITTQRHLSFARGQGDALHVRRVFSNSLLLHLIIGVLMTVVLLLLEAAVMNHLLVIDAGRLAVACRVYRFMSLSLFATFVTAPYKALFIARENIVFVSLVDVADGVLKLVIAIVLFRVAGDDRLGCYGFLMMLVSFFNYVVLALWGRSRFAECVLVPKRGDVDAAQLRQVMGFAVWTIYSMGCVMGRTQGIAVVLNRFFGTLLNTSYGIALQVFSAVQRVSQAVLNAVSPQLISSEGASERAKMLRLAAATSKYSFLLLALVVIPVVFEMRGILSFWLGEVPPHADTMCCFILLATLCDQTTIGLNTANQAMGRIRNFSLCVNTTKLMTIPLAWLCVRWLGQADVVMWCYLLVEALCAALRLPLLRHSAGLAIGRFLRAVLLPALLPLGGMVVVSWAVTTYVTMPLRFLLTFLLAVSVGCMALWATGLSAQEKSMVRKMLCR